MKDHGYYDMGGGSGEPTTRTLLSARYFKDDLGKNYFCLQRVHCLTI